MGQGTVNTSFNLSLEMSDEPAKRLFFMECHLAGRQYHDVDEVWDRLKVGTKLRLERDMDIGVSSPVPFSVHVNWYCSLYRLVLQFIIASIAFDSDFFCRL